MQDLTKSEIEALWYSGILTWKLHPVQLKIYNVIRNLPSDVREALVFCARRFGKSYLECIMALEDALQNPNVNVYIIGPNRRQAGAIVRPIMRRIMEDCPPGLVIPTSQHIYKLHNGSEIALVGFDSALESMRGSDAFNIYLEETGQATADVDEYSYMFKSVYRPTLQHSRGKIIHFTTPARIVDHPLHTETLPVAKENGAFFKYTIRDNPRLSKEVVDEEIKELGGMDSIHTRRELFCEIVRDDSLVAVPAFSEEHHVTDQVFFKDWANYIVCGDFGGSQDLHFWLLIMFSHDLGVPVVMEERWWNPSTSSSEIIKEISTSWNQWTKSRVVDAPSQVRIDMAQDGFSTFLPQKAKFEETLAYLRDKFFTNRALISSRCPKLTETLRSGTLNNTRTDWARTPTLGHCDGLMALVYGLRYIDMTFDIRPKVKSANSFNIKDETPPSDELAGLWEQ